MNKTRFAATSGGMKPAIILFFAMGLINYSLTCAAQAHVTLTSLLHELTDRNAITRMPYPTFTLKQFSSYDRHSVSPDQPGWFAGADANNYLRTDQGPGI